MLPSENIERAFGVLYRGWCHHHSYAWSALLGTHRSWYSHSLYTYSSAIPPNALGVPCKKFLVVHPAQFFTPKRGTRLFRKIWQQNGRGTIQVVATVCHSLTLIEMWITCLDLVSANSEKCIGSQRAVRVGQRLQSRFEKSGAARNLGLVQIIVEASEIRGGFRNT